MIFRHILLFILFFSNFSMAQAQTFYLDDEVSNVNIGLIGDFFHDETGTITLTDLISKNYKNQFLPINSDFMQFGLIKGNIWVKAKINVANITSLDQVIKVHAPRLQILDIYIPQLNDTAPITVSGELRPLSDKSHYPHTLIPLSDTSQPVIDIYIKMSSSTPINATINIFPINDLTTNYQIEHIVSGLLIGMIILIFFSNIIFYIMSGNIMYLLYSVVLINAIVLHFVLHEYLVLLFPDIFYIQNQIYNISILITTIATLLFSRAYLETKHSLPILDLYLILFCLVVGFFTLLSIFTPALISSAHISLLISLSALSLTVVSIVASLKKIPYANYYLAARLTLFLGYCYWALNAYGVLSSSVYFLWGLTITILLEALIHFFAVFARFNPFIHKSLKKKESTVYNQQPFELIEDLTVRIRRQTNTISGFLTPLQNNHILAEQDEIQNIEQANRNLEHLLERLENINGSSSTFSKSTRNYIYVDNLIDETLNMFHELDQDQVHVTLSTSNISKDEQISETRLLKNLLLTLLLEFRNFSHQTLNATLQKVVNSQEGISYLDLIIDPLPRHIAEDNENRSNLGLGYIHHLLNQLNGKVLPSNSTDTKLFHIQIPVRYKLVDRKPEINNIQACQLVIMGNHSNTGRSLYTLLQTWPISIIQVKDMTELKKLEIQKSTKRSINIVILMEHSGYIPQLAIQHIKPLLRIEDQCLLVSNNMKMSKEFVLIQGFDELIHSLELEQQLKTIIIRLTEKGLRLQEARLLS